MRMVPLSETSDDYPNVVAILSDGKTRVIVCRDGIQWIVQRRQGNRWNPQSFCHTKEALLLCCGHDPHPALAALPDDIKESDGSPDGSPDDAPMTHPEPA
jgi:hypothetical protein